MIHTHPASLWHLTLRLVAAITVICAGCMAAAVGFAAQTPGGVLIYTVGNRYCKPDSALVAGYFSTGVWNRTDELPLFDESHLCLVFSESPACSPDGETIAFTSNYVPEYRHFSGTTRVIVLRLYDPGRDILGELRLDRDTSDADWSPDGTRLVLSHRQGQGTANLIMVRRYSTDRLVLTDTGLNSRAKWSPDGGRIAFEVSMFGISDIHLMDADGRNPRLLIRNARLLRWSPDGQSLVIFRQEPGIEDRTVYLYNISRDTRLQLFPPNLHVVDLDWSPDGQRIALIAEIDGQRDVFVLEGSRLHRVTNNAYLETSLCWLR